MKLYLLWVKKQKNANVLDITRIVDDAHELAPHIPRLLFANKLVDLLGADEVVTAKDEQEMTKMFGNVAIFRQYLGKANE